MTTTANTMAQPWYRQGWPWFLISLPASAVIGGIATIIIAVNSPNALVSDDYYKNGLAINQTKQRLYAAQQMNLEGLLRIGDNGLATLSIKAGEDIDASSLSLNISHFTRSELDQALLLQRQSPGQYTGKLAASLRDGTWYIRLQPQDAAWEVRSRMVSTGGAIQTVLNATD